MTEKIVSILAEETGLPRDAFTVSLRAPLDHQSNRLYDVWAGDRHLAVKEFLKPAEFGHAPVREYRSLVLLADTGIAPQPILYRPISAASPRPLVIYEYLEGEMWDRYCPSAGELAELADLWTTVASIPGEDLWPARGAERSFEELEATLRSAFQEYAAWAKAEYPAGLELAHQCRTVLQSRHGVVEGLSGQAPGWCFCHADPRFANIIRRPDAGLGWVDWEDAGLRDPARDLADFVRHPNQEDLLSMEEWRPFLDPCLASRASLDPGVRHRFHLYLALFPLGYLAVLLREGVRRAAGGNLRGWKINGIPANERLRRFLARAQAWPEADFTAQLLALSGKEFFDSS